MKARTRRKKLTVQKKLACSFCKEKTEPDYKKPEALGRFITGRGKILGRMRTGLCQKHQRRLKINIKRARFLSLLSFAKQL